MLLDISERLEPYTPTDVPAYRATDVNLAGAIDDGMRGLVIDWEGMAGETGNPQGDPEICNYIQRHLGARGIQFLAIGTNLTVDRNTPASALASQQLLEGWRLQVGADVVLSPLPDREHGFMEFKPGPAMFLKGPELAMRHAGVELELSEFGVIDDKLSAGVAAGYFAGYGYRFKTRSWGDNRAPLDRYIRGPFEEMLTVRAHLLHNPVIPKELRKILAEQTGETDIEITQEDVEAFANQIVGYGIEDVDLTEDAIALLRTPKAREMLNELQEFYAKNTDVPKEKLIEHLKENGRTYAELATWTRLLDAAVIYAVHRSDLSPEVKLIIQSAVYVEGQIKDVVDGPFARADKNGATEKGGIEDQTIDKILSAVADRFMLLPRELITNADFWTSVTRDIATTLIRIPFRRRGIDTSSVYTGKRAMLALAGSQIFSSIFGETYPRAARRIRTAANIAKVGSAIHAPIVWVQKDEFRKHEINNQLRELMEWPNYGPEEDEQLQLWTPDQL